MLMLQKSVAHPWMCDVMGHVTTRFYVAMFDDASYHLLYELFGWTGEAGAKDGFGWADVRHEIDYLSEVAAGDILEIRGGVTKVGSKSLGLRYEMTNLANGELAATLSCICVYFDLSARKAVALSDDMQRRAGQQLLPA